MKELMFSVNINNYLYHEEIFLFFEDDHNHNHRYRLHPVLHWVICEVISLIFITFLKPWQWESYCPQVYSFGGGAAYAQRVSLSSGKRYLLYSFVWNTYFQYWRDMKIICFLIQQKQTIGHTEIRYFSAFQIHTHFVSSLWYSRFCPVCKVTLIYN